MKIIYETSDTELAEIVSSPFFAELVTLLEAEIPTLRHLKEVFGNKVEKKLEKLIKKGIIQRKERRYFIAFPILEIDNKLLDDWVVTIVKSASEKNKRERIAFLEALFPHDNSEIFCGIETSIPLAYYDSLSNENLTVASLSVEEWPLTLPRYFSNLRTKPIEPVYKEVAQLIGDVDPKYYLDQVQVVIEKILVQRRRIRESIFIESMRKFGLIHKTEPLELCVPVYSSASSFEMQPQFNQLSVIMKRIILAKVMTELNVTATTSIFIKEER
ncbi:hypothetical protein DOK78_001579 [Enterococcus sp. DIV2402]|uniref:DUF1803 domain-containing protein n=1 Tax=Candidatus Enterococcus lowellii TaxID=2230877 RepID=A0ABZ2SN41_9ENTE|nr:DUF1803 domain-containing protein [Enterococcus sp. DIV2402]MBO0464231.1 DUF1803 domain-containing protein [Enterococcus sp. DIV2402]